MKAERDADGGVREMIGSLRVHSFVVVFRASCTMGGNRDADSARFVVYLFTMCIDTQIHTHTQGRHANVLSPGADAR